MAPSPAHRSIRIAAVAALAFGLVSLVIGPARGADDAATPAHLVGPRSAPTPDRAFAVLRTITLPNDRLPDPSYGLAVGVGPDAGDAIYIAAGNNYEGTLLRVNPVSLTIDDTTAVGNYPLGIAVSHDDTIYVVNADSNTMSVIQGSSMTVRSTIAVPTEPQAVALSRRAVDDTVFISSKSFFNSAQRKITMFDARTLGNRVETLLPSAAMASAWGLAVGNDDTAYMAGGDTIYRFNSATRDVSSAVTGAQGPIGVAVSSDDTVYFTRQGGNAVSRFPAANPGDLVNRSVSSPQGVAVGPDGRVYVAGQFGGGIITVVNPVTFAVDDSIAIGDRWNSIAVTRSGLVVAADRYAPSAVVAAEVSPALGAPAGVAGSTGVVTIGGLPTGVLIDDSTVTSVRFNGVPAAGWSRIAGTNTLTGPIPNGTGTVEATVTLNGGNTASAGAFTYTVPPPPPPTPSSVPRDVVASGADGSASVSWSAPASSGSFPVSHYLATSSPGGRTCLATAPALACDVMGLSNGTAYTFTVTALTGAGWSESSAPSNAVVPRAQPKPSIVITGSRDGQRIQVTGSTIGFGMGAILDPWVKLSGQSAYSQGSAQVLVSMDGTFEWGRNTGRNASVYMQTPDGSVRSNTVRIR